jgi:pyruvate,water dikinase
VKLSSVVALSDPAAQDPAVSGAKAANLARAAATGFPTVPGFVITTAGVESGLDDPRVADEVRRAHEGLAGPGGESALVVRSSSVIEDTGESSMAGRFASVLDVVGWDNFVAAFHTVVASAASVRSADGNVGAMAVLVQPQVYPRFGGVMFGVDPVTGRNEHVVVEVVPSGPDALVGGTTMADHYVLTRRGRIESATLTGGAPRLESGRRRELAGMARRAERVFGRPQDIEWLVDHDRLYLLQSRPVTAIAAADDHRRSVLLGPGPLAETFPSPLRPLEVDLWIPPLRDGITRALRTTGAVSRGALERSPVATTVGGWPAVDLELIGVADARTSFRSRINPLAMLRRLTTAWRIGRLRVALPTLVADVIATVDRDLSEIPRLDDLATVDLVDLVERGRRELATAHTYEVLSGMLLNDPSTLTGAAIALQALHDARLAGWDDDAIVAGSPVVLVLVPPSLEATALPATSPSVGSSDGMDHLGYREALRVRVRWLQEFLARAADEVGRRLVSAGVVPDAQAVGFLQLSELTSIADGGPPPADLAERAVHWPGPPLPVSFRLSVAGDVRPASVSSHGRRPEPSTGMPAGGGRTVGVVCHRPDSAVSGEWGGASPAGTDGPILVTRHLEPQLAPYLGDLTGLVSETGSALSHLAILAREAGLPTVVGVPDALRRFPAGTRLMIDGRTGEIEVLDTPAVPAGETPLAAP